MYTLTYVIAFDDYTPLLDETLKSLINQRNKDFTLLLVTDTPIEKSNEVINEMLSHSSIQHKVKVMKEINNHLELMNKAMDFIETDYFMFLDPGDILPSYSTAYLRKHLGLYDLIIPTLFQKTYNIPQYVDTDLIKKTQNIKELNTIDNFRTSSMVGIIFSKEFCHKYKIKLNIHLDIYSYWGFVLENIEHNVKFLLLKNFPLYYREENYPTLDILKFAENDFDDEFSEYVDVIISAYQYAHFDEIKEFIKMDLIEKIEIEFDPHHPQIEERHHNNKEALNKAMSFIDRFIIDKKKPFFNLEMLALKYKNEHLATKINDFRYRARLLKQVLSKHRTKNRSWYELKNKYVKVDSETIVFESFAGQAYSDSPKAIYEYMVKNYPQYNYKWILRRPNTTQVPGNAEKLKRYSKEAYSAYSKAGFWITNARLPLHIEKKENQVYIQTWHGTPLKRLGNDMDIVKMPGTNTERYKRNFKNETSRWDILLSPNRYSTEIFQSAFWMDKKNILEIGYPRNDVLVNRGSDQAYINEIKEKLNLPKDKKVILYAPTWRDDEYIKKGQYNFELKINLEDMYEKLGDEYIILLRMHYLISNVLDIKGYENFAIDVSKYNNISELYLISDCLITDYSSVMFDYGILKRPQLFFAYDLEKYEGELRGFYLDYMKDLPGPIVKTSDELLEKLENLNTIEDYYKNSIEEFYERFCSVDHGIAAKVVGDMIHEKILETKLKI